MADAPDWLVEAREIQESVQLDSCRIERVTVRFDRDLKRDVEDVVEVYEGPCRYPRADGAMRVNVTGMTVTPVTPVVIVPWHVVEVQADDRVTCIDSVSPGNTGRVLWVTDGSPRTYQSAVHLTCREVRGG